MEWSARAAAKAIESPTFFASKVRPRDFSARAVLFSGLLGYLLIEKSQPGQALFFFEAGAVLLSPTTFLPVPAKERRERWLFLDRPSFHSRLRGNLTGYGKPWRCSLSLR